MRLWLPFLLPAASILATAAHAERIRLYEQENYRGGGKLFALAEQNLRTEDAPTRVASAKVITGRWLLCERAFFTGSCAWVSRDVPSFHALAFSGDLGSLRPERVPVIRRQWGGRHPPPRSALVLFPEADFEGDWIAIKESTPNLEAAGISLKPGSVVLQSGAWRLCSQPDYGGACLSMTASSWNLKEIFTTEIRSVERFP
jgi:hypothetical protein